MLPPEKPAGMPFWIKFLLAFFVVVAGANAVFIKLALAPRDLVRKDYYAAGLLQDARMARQAAQAGLDIGLHDEAGGWSVDAGKKSGTADTATAGVNPLRAKVCEAHFYRPDDGAADRVLKLIRSEAPGTDGKAVWRGPALDLKRGHWEINLVWIDGDRPVMETLVHYYSPG